MDWKFLVSLLMPSAFALYLYYTQRRTKKSDDLSASYVDSRFEFASKAEQNLWAEIYSLRKDVAAARQEYIELLFKYVDLLIETGKVDLIREAKANLRAKLQQVVNEEKQKTTAVEQKLVEHSTSIAKVDGAEEKN